MSNEKERLASELREERELLSKHDAKLQSVNEQIAQLKKRKQTILNKRQSEARKAATRAKIVLGGGLLAYLEKVAGEGRQGVPIQILDAMSERDRLFFETWYTSRKNK